MTPKYTTQPSIYIYETKAIGPSLCKENIKPEGKACYKLSEAATGYHVQGKAWISRVGTLERVLSDPLAVLGSPINPTSTAISHVWICLTVTITPTVEQSCPMLQGSQSLGIVATPQNLPCHSPTTALGPEAKLAMEHHIQAAFRGNSWTISGPKRICE